MWMFDLKDWKLDRDYGWTGELRLMEVPLKYVFYELMGAIAFKGLTLASKVRLDGLLYRIGCWFLDKTEDETGIRVIDTLEIDDVMIRSLFDMEDDEDED